MAKTILNGWGTPCTAAIETTGALQISNPHILRTPSVTASRQQEKDRSSLERSHPTNISTYIALCENVQEDTLDNPEQ
jgi:hypothetical protein